MPALLVSGVEGTSTVEVPDFFEAPKGEEVDDTVTSWGSELNSAEKQLKSNPQKKTENASMNHYFGRIFTNFYLVWSCFLGSFQWQLHHITRSPESQLTKQKSCRDGPAAAS